MPRSEVTRRSTRQAFDAYTLPSAHAGKLSPRNVLRMVGVVGGLTALGLAVHAGQPLAVVDFNGGSGLMPLIHSGHGGPAAPATMIAAVMAAIAAFGAVLGPTRCMAMTMAISIGVVLLIYTLRQSAMTLGLIGEHCTGHFDQYCTNVDVPHPTAMHVSAVAVLVVGLVAVVLGVLADDER